MAGVDKHKLWGTAAGEQHEQQQPCSHDGMARDWLVVKQGVMGKDRVG